MIAIILFTEYDEFGELSLYSKYNRVKEFNELFITFKSVEIKKKNRNTTQKRANYEKCQRALQKVL